MTSTITFHGPPQSSYMRTARWTCSEKGVDHEVVPLSDGYDKIHPWKKIPSMTVGDVTLFETSAICRYIDETHEGPSLMPSDPLERAVAEQWISALNCYGYDAIVRGFALNHFIIPSIRGQEPNLEGIDESVARLNSTLDKIESGFAGPWFVGGAISLADLFLGPMLATAVACPHGAEAINAHPKLAAFLAAINDRPTYLSIQPGQ